MTWEILLGIIALVSFVGTVATWIYKLSRILATLDATIKSLNETLQEFRERSHRTHKELFERINEQEKAIADHETRINVLEKNNK